MQSLPKGWRIGDEMEFKKQTLYERIREIRTVGVVGEHIKDRAIVLEALGISEEDAKEYLREQLLR